MICHEVERGEAQGEPGGRAFGEVMARLIHGDVAYKKIARIGENRFCLTSDTEGKLPFAFLAFRSGARPEIVDGRCRVGHILS
jgi:hypothetical protein